MKEEVANMIFRRGIFQLSPEHLPPFNINLQRDNLEEKDYNLIVEVLWDLIAPLKFDAIAGISEFGKLIVFALDRFISEQRKKFWVTDIVSVWPGERVLLVGNLIKEGESKLNIIKIVESRGAKVHDLVVLIDYNMNASVRLAQAGYCLWSCFSIKQLLTYYKVINKIDSREFHRCFDYTKNS